MGGGISWGKGSFHWEGHIFQRYLKTIRDYKKKNIFSAESKE